MRGRSRLTRTPDASHPRSLGGSGLESLDRIADDDLAVGEDVRAQPAAVDQAAQDAELVDEAREAEARLAQLDAPPPHGAHPEAPPAPPLEVGPARSERG